MEFLKVVVPDHDDPDTDVLLNGEPNGKVGEVLTVSEGFVEISVDLDGAETKVEEVMDTTEDEPMVVEIEVVT